MLLIQLPHRLPVYAALGSQAVIPRPAAAGGGGGTQAPCTLERLASRSPAPCRATYGSRVVHGMEAGVPHAAAFFRCVDVAFLAAVAFWAARLAAHGADDRGGASHRLRSRGSKGHDYEELDVGSDSELSGHEEQDQEVRGLLDAP